MMSERCMIMKGKVYKSSESLEGESLAVAILHLSEKIENNNRLIMTLIRRIEQLEKSLEQVKEEEIEQILSDVDEKIVNLVKEKGRVTASDVKAELNYKGTNAASARLNKLCSMGVLKKQYAGRKVYFSLAR